LPELVEGDANASKKYKINIFTKMLWGIEKGVLSRIFMS
jgi:hypothetical protein